MRSTDQDLMLQGGFEPVLYVLPQAARTPNKALRQHADRIFEATESLGVEEVRVMNDELYDQLPGRPVCRFAHERPCDDTALIDQKIALRRSLGAIVCNDSADRCENRSRDGIIDRVIGELICGRDRIFGVAFSEDNTYRFDELSLAGMAVPKWAVDIDDVGYHFGLMRLRDECGADVRWDASHFSGFQPTDMVTVNTPGRLRSQVRKQFEYYQQSMTVEDLMTTKGER